MKTEREPWQDYYAAFVERAGRIPTNAFDRGELLFEAAHDAYQTTTDRLTAAGWDAERALMVGRIFGTVVKDWVERGGQDVDALRSELRTHYQQWTTVDT